MSKIILNCQFCQQPFEKLRGEFNRSEKLGRKHYCSMVCFGKDSGHLNAPKSGCPERLLPGGWQKNELSPFRLIFNSSRMHTRKRRDNREFNITIGDLLKQWISQDGVCPLTGWKMVLPRSTNESVKKTPNRASLDRIDSTKGYTPDNIRFVCLMAQYAKNCWSDEDVLLFSVAVATRAKS